MPDDVGGTPFPDGWMPDDDHDRGLSDEEFAAVVFDEDFVKAAAVHEPTAVERLLAAAQARAEAAEAESRRAHTRGRHHDDPYGDPELDGLYDPDALDDDHYGRPGYGRQVRWHRPVAWLLALVMGVGMVVLAFAAVYRGASSANRQDPAPPPATTGVEQGEGGRAAAPSASADSSRPVVPAVPQTP